jgi:hypothetical protein
MPSMIDYMVKADKSKSLNRPTQRIDKRSAEYLLNRALQTPGLLKNDNWLRACELLIQERAKNGGKPEMPKEHSDKLRRLLGKKADTDQSNVGNVAETGSDTTSDITEISE